MAFRIGEFEFETKEEAEQARKEEEAVAYVRRNLDWEDREAVEKLYRQLQENDTFGTVIGRELLEELRQAVKGDGNQMSAQEKRKTRPGRTAPEGKGKVFGRKRKEKKIRSLQEYRRLAHFFGFTSLVMLLIIFGMFAVNITSHNPTILDYQQKLIDRYAAWDMELTEREEELKKLQQSLEEKQRELEQMEQSRQE